MHVAKYPLCHFLDVCHFSSDVLATYMIAIPEEQQLLQVWHAELFKEKTWIFLIPNPADPCERRPAAALRLLTLVIPTAEQKVALRALEVI